MTLTELRAAVALAATMTCRNVRTMPVVLLRPSERGGTDLLAQADDAAQLEVHLPDVAWEGATSTGAEHPWLAVDARALHRQARATLRGRGATLTLRGVGRELEVRDTMGASRYPLHEVEPATNPEIPEVLTAARVDLLEALDAVVPAVSTDDNRWGLNGASLEPLGERELHASSGCPVQLVGTDGSRLHAVALACSLAADVAVLPVDPDALPRARRKVPQLDLGAGGRTGYHLLPRPELLLARRLLRAAKGTASCSLGVLAPVEVKVEQVPGPEHPVDRTLYTPWAGWWSLRCGCWTLRARLVEGEFPAWRAVVPELEQYEGLELSRTAELVAQVRTMAALTVDRNASGRVDVTAAGTMILSSSSVDVGSRSQELPREVLEASAARAFGINLRLWLEALVAADRHQLQLLILPPADKPLDPVLIKADTMLGIVMPLRLD